MKKRGSLKSSSTIAIASILFGCGIKGPPMPPDEPPAIGRGQPTYKKAVEEFVMPPKSQATEDEQDKKSEDEENEK